MGREYIFIFKFILNFSFKIFFQNVSFLFIGSICFLAYINNYAFAQEDPFANQQNDLNIGGDIFSDFNDDLDSTNQVEDERYYRYGRFFSFQIGIGLNQFDGNRGQAYIKDPPTINFGINYFMDFKTSFGLGFDISKNHFVIHVPTKFTKVSQENPGLISVNHLTAYFNYRYYFDTSNLGTAITYSNPYFVMRIEYWYQTLKYLDLIDFPDDTGGGLGFSFGGGFEFPLKIRESYLGLEMLIHSVNLPDKFTTDWQPIDANGQVIDTGQGFPDLNGNAYSIVVTYVINW